MGRQVLDELAIWIYRLITRGILEMMVTIQMSILPKDGIDLIINDNDKGRDMEIELDFKGMNYFWGRVKSSFGAIKRLPIMI